MRAFFCFKLPQNVKKEIAALSDEMSGEAYVKWVSIENLHITAKFLGDTPETQIAEIKREAKSALKGMNNFQFIIDKFGCFPDRSYPKVLWLGSSNPPVEIFSIQSKLEENLQSIGFDKGDRDYIPHVTLGRTKEKNNRKIKKYGDNLSEYQMKESWKVDINNLTLMESKLRSGGPIYTEVFKLELES